MVDRCYERRSNDLKAIRAKYGLSMGVDYPDLGVFLGPRNEEGKKLSKNVTGH